MLYSLFSYALLLIFGIIIRRFLLQQFNTEIVGYEEKQETGIQSDLAGKAGVERSVTE